MFSSGNPELMSALAGIARLGAAPSVTKRAKKLPAEARAELRSIQKRFADDRKAAIEALFAKYPAAKMLSPKEMSEIRQVVDLFILNDDSKVTSSGVQSDGGMTLKVGGKVVAERKAPYSRFMRVCAGEFGADMTSRRAANALLDALGAGLSFRDRDGRAFITPKGRGAGRLVSESACHTVEVNASMRNRAVANVNRAIREAGLDIQRFAMPTEGASATSPVQRAVAAREATAAAERAAVAEAYRGSQSAAAQYESMVSRPTKRQQAARKAAATRRRNASRR
jgi:hypothetical protein